MRLREVCECIESIYHEEPNREDCMYHQPWKTAKLFAARSKSGKMERILGTRDLMEWFTKKSNDGKNTKSAYFPLGGSKTSCTTKTEPDEDPCTCASQGDLLSPVKVESLKKGASTENTGKVREKLMILWKSNGEVWSRSFNQGHLSNFVIHYQYSKHFNDLMGPPDVFIGVDESNRKVAESRKRAYLLRGGKDNSIRFVCSIF